MSEIISEVIIDNIKILPFLFLTYLFLEWIEEKSETMSLEKLQNSKSLGPLVGGMLGVIPQCGFSAATANLYAGGLISRGAVLAVFLSTSDEMLPILFSHNAPLTFIVRVMLYKAICGILAGIACDVIEKKLYPSHRQTIHEMCEKEDCHCEDGMIVSALRHTLKIFLFLLIISLIIEFTVDYIGTDAVKQLLLNRPVFGELIAASIGLIPNCAASVVITTLYMEGAMSAGALLSGLLASSGVGLLVLFRMNHNMKDSLITLGSLYGLSVLFGLVANILPII